MSKEKKDKHFIKKPVYPGGTAAFNEFLKSNLKYPKEAKEKKIEGTVVVKYSIDHLGKVSDTKVIRSLGHGCDEEAERVIKLLKFEIPKGPRKLKVLFHKEAKIQFKLKKSAKPKPTTQPSYNITTSTKKKDPAERDTKKSTSYFYKIEW